MWLDAGDVYPPDILIIKFDGSSVSSLVGVHYWKIVGFKVSKGVCVFVHKSRILQKTKIVTVNKNPGKASNCTITVC